MSRIFSLTLTLVAAATMSYAAMIDNFNMSLVQSARDSFADGVAVTNVLGSRTIFANKLVGVDGLFLDSVVTAQADGSFNGSAGTGVSGTTGATYTGLWNLTSPIAGLSIDLLRNDLPGSTISFWLSDGTKSAYSPQYSLPVLQSGPSALIVALFSDFTGIGAVNMAAVKSLGFVNTHAPNGDLSLDNFATYIPEPGTYAMMAAGLLGLFAIRRKRA